MPNILSVHDFPLYTVHEGIYSYASAAPLARHDNPLKAQDRHDRRPPPKPLEVEMIANVHAIPNGESYWPRPLGLKLEPPALTPYPIAQSRVSLPIASPDQALAFDPTTGMFDASYAAAWTLGRMIALQDTAFSTALYNWKRGVWQSAVDGVENDLLDKSFGSMLGGGVARAAALTVGGVHDREPEPDRIAAGHRAIDQE